MDPRDECKVCEEPIDDNGDCACPDLADDEGDDCDDPPYTWDADDERRARIEREDYGEDG